MDRCDEGVKASHPDATRTVAGQRHPDAGYPGGPAGGAASGPPSSGLPDARAVCRGLRAMREVLDGHALRDGPIRYTLVLVDDIVPLLDQAIGLLEVSSRPAAAGPGPASGPAAPGTGM